MKWLPLVLAVLLWSVVVGVLLPWALDKEYAIERAAIEARHGR